MTVNRWILGLRSDLGIAICRWKRVLIFFGNSYEKPQSLVHSIRIGKCIGYIWFKSNYIAEASAARTELPDAELS